jgi:tRNA threonylcarbamoyladenosine biosynthesis protein TsaB
MLVLAMDTATNFVSVAIGDAGAVLGEVRLGTGRRHAEQLVPAVRYLCAETGVELGQLAAIAVGTGPGLFTGLRVGVTTAKVMAQALRVPVVGVPSLDLVAWPLRSSRRTVVAVLDARRREVFHARYRPVPGGLQREGDYEVGPPADLVADLLAAGEEVLLAGGGVGVYCEAFAGLEHAEHAGPEFATPSVAALVELAARRVELEEFAQPWELAPLYLRASDAEIDWERVRAGAPK